MRVVKVAVWVWIGMLGMGWAGTVWGQCACEVPVVSAAPAPIAAVDYLPVVTEPVMPSPVVVYRPAAVAPAFTPVVSPVVVYRPVFPVVSAAPTVLYRPVVSTGLVTPAPVVVGPPAVIRTKVYYPGEPIRNLIKAITP